MPNTGETITITIDSAAHGGEGVARHEGMVVFVPGAVPGDRITAELVDVKKRFSRAQIISVDEPSPHRVAERCPAAEAGAGCCDYSMVSPEYELELKKTVLCDQLERIGKLEDLPEIEVVDLLPTAGWRTRFRLGVDGQGRAGFRAKNSNEIITGKTCAQAAPGVLDDLLASGGFTPGAELVVAVGSDGQRTVVETRKAARGRSVTRHVRTISGPEGVMEKVSDTTFNVDPLGFWQAHTAAPKAYNDAVTSWLASSELPDNAVGWDLYGGVGLFVPAVLAAAPNAEVFSVELGKRAAQVGREALPNENVHFVTGDVAKVVDKLPDPDLIVLDPPRKGAGAATIHACGVRGAKTVVHVGCDPATLARDLSAWSEHGYRVQALKMFNAFPGTHHSETFAFLTRD